jgi:glycosyltransferase involved in cell wall biosynthesis
MQIMIFAPGFPPWKIGGEEYYSYYQATNLANLGHEVFVIAENNKTGYSGILRETDSITIFLNKHRPAIGFFNSIISFFQYFFAALKLRRRPDVIHGHDTMGAGLAAVFFGKLFFVPVIITWHGAELIGRRFSLVGNLSRRIVCHLADGVIVNSRLFKSLALENVGMRYADKFSIIPPGVDTREFRPRSQNKSIILKHSLSNSLIVLSVGRLESIKGFDTLIASIPPVLRVFPEAKFLIIGKGSQMKSLKKIAQDLKVENSVIFVGAVDRKWLPHYYSACDVFVVPTKCEGFGMVFLEAWACNKPIIVSPHAPAIAILVRNIGGGIVTVNKPKEISKSIITLLSNKNLRLEMGKIGRNIALEFSWQKMVRSTILEYNKVRKKKYFSNKRFF